MPTKVREWQMPIKEESMLKKQAKKKGLKGERADAYVYGTMNKIKEARAAKRKRNAKK